MIITSKLCWVHLPKTAGTTTDHLFSKTALPLLWRDSQDSPVKHIPVFEHPSYPVLPINGQHFVSNFRRLPSWLLSNYQHKLIRMGIKLSPENMRKGFFWREKDKNWLPADWWLNRFGIDESWSLLRVEHLKNDFLSCLSCYQPISISTRIKIRMASSLNCNSYSHRLDEWFTADDLRTLYAANPLWSHLEFKRYGNLVSLP